MLLVRKIVGESMLPGLLPGDVIIGFSWWRRYRVGDLVIIHHSGLEKIKRIVQMRADKVYVLGDNLSASKDSRHFGWLDSTSVKAKVIWRHKRSHS